MLLLALGFVSTVFTFPAGCSRAAEGGMLYFEAAGTGPGLAFIHAGVADSRMWDAEYADFAPRYRVVRMDLRGCGCSPLTPGRFSYHDDVAEVLRAAGVDHAALVGCSFGASVAVETALAYPELVDYLVLVSPSLGGGASEEMDRFGEEEEALLERGDLDGATELNLRMWVDGPHRRPDQVTPGVRERVRVMQRDAFAMETPEGVERVRLDPPAERRLKEIRVPTLILVGALDVPYILRASERLAREIPGARRIVIPGTAHLPSLERPEAFRGALEEFLPP
jgi:3-oxoadipate enol-lactonase